MKFETAVKEIVPRTVNVKSFRFPKPEALDYKPGQFLLMTLKSGGQEMMKPFSISSSPTEKEHIEFTKKLTDSEFSTALNGLKVGDWARKTLLRAKFQWRLLRSEVVSRRQRNCALNL